MFTIIISAIYILISTFLFGVLLKWSFEEGELDLGQSFTLNVEHLILIFGGAYTHPIWITLLLLFLLGMACVYALTKRTLQKLPNRLYYNLSYHLDHYPFDEFKTLINSLSPKELKHIKLCMTWTIIHMNNPQEAFFGRKIDDLSFEEEVLEK